MYKGTMYSIVFDHRPTQKEALIAITEKMEGGSDYGEAASLYACADKYIESKSNVLSVSTIRGYRQLSRAISSTLGNKNIYNIEQIDIQNEINEYSLTHSPKSTRNLHGLISAILGMFRPTMHIYTTLPIKRPYEAHTPSEEDIKKILLASENSNCHVGFQLGILGMRRSEVCAAQISDIDGNILHINKSMVVDDKGNWIIQNRNKTDKSTRDIYLPDSLVKEIRSQGYIYNSHPNHLNNMLHRYQKQLGIDAFRFHDLRAYYVSYAHEHGMSEQSIMASGGWASPYTMRKVYRRTMEKEKVEAQKRIADMIM